MSRLINKNANQIQSRQYYYSVIVSSLGFVFFTCAILYAYFLCVSVSEVVMRKEISQNLAKIKTETAELEARYIVGQHAVSDRIAKTEFKDVNEKIFVYRTTPTVALKSNN